MKLTLTILLAAILSLTATARPVDGDTRELLKRIAPNTFELLEAAEQPGDEEFIEEARDRAHVIAEEYHHAREEDGEEWAEIQSGFTDVEIALEFTVWRHETGKISEPQAERIVRNLLKIRLRLENREDRRELGEIEHEIAEIEERIEWREANPEEALEEAFEEFLEHLGRHGEEEEEDEPPFEASGPVYTPPPSDRPDPSIQLTDITYDFEKHITPALERYCLDCHDADTAKGDIDLESALSQQPLVRNRLLWENVAERIRNGDMPPEKKPQPGDGTRLQLRAWLHKEIDNFDYTSVRNPGHVPARRLTREEYNRTIRDLTGLDLRPADQFPMDFSGTSGFSNSANTLFLQTAHLDRYMTAADDVIDAVRADPTAWSNLPDLNTFLHRAYRRPPTALEVAETNTRYQSALKSGRSPDDARADTLKSILISPHFLLRVEQSAPAGSDQPVSDHDLATRLSYFLWASTPDQELLEAAAANQLTNPSTRHVQVERLLTDPRSSALGEIFAAEWLKTDDVGPRIRKDPIDNPWCTETLMAAMRGETAHFFNSLVAENAPVARLLDADYTFLNAELAEFYRLPDVEGDHMRRVDLDTDQRGGLFGHGAILATTSFPDRTSPVVRGAWILETLLGTPPPPPPPNVPEIDADGGGREAARSLRKKLERHRESKQCAGCHAQIDPLGFALESYANFGQWRPGVDNRGTLPNGAEFRGPEGLKLALIDTRLDDLGTQLIRKMLAYALGRQLEFYDETTVREIAATLKPDGYRLRDLVFAITDSYPFTTKRLPAE